MSHTTKNSGSVNRKETDNSTEHLEHHRPARTALRNKIHHTDPADYEDLDELNSFEKM